MLVLLFVAVVCTFSLLSHSSFFLCVSHCALLQLLLVGILWDLLVSWRTWRTVPISDLAWLALRLGAEGASEVRFRGEIR